jgi:DNA-binding beta-propeller fold protein YncE
MQLNKNVLIVGGGLLVLAAATAVLVLKAPGRKGAAGSAGSAEAVGLAKPRAMAYGAKGELIIVDSKNDRLEIRQADGKVKHVGRRGTSKGEFREPCGVAVDKDGNIFVADTFYTQDPNGGLPWGRIQKFEKDYDFKAEFGKVEGGNPNLFGPRAIAVDGQGRVWLSDTGNGRLLVYDGAGKFIKEVGRKGKKDLEFDEPFGVAFDAQGNAYVADRLNFRIQVISPTFAFVRQFKVDGWENAQINVEPYLAIDQAKGLLYVSDPTKKKVHRYDLSGKGHKAYDKANDGPALVAFSLPTGLVVAADGSVMVSDGGSGRILTLKP